MSEIVILSPFHKFTQMVQQVCDELNEHVDVIEAVGRSAVNVVKDLERNGTKVIIARKFTASSLQQSESPIPIIDLKMSEMDLFRNIHHFHAKGYQRIGLIFYGGELFEYDLASFEKMLGIQLIPLPFNLPPHSFSNIDQQVARALKLQVDIVLTTGACISKKCWESGIPAEVIFPKTDSVIQAIQKAKDMIQINQYYMEYNRKLELILNSTSDGMIVLNHNMTVVMMNKHAENIFQVSKDEILDQPLTHLGIDPDNLRKNVDHSQLLNIRGKQYVMKSTPIESERENNWKILLTLQDVSEVQKLDQTIRLSHKGLQAKYRLHDIKGKSPLIQNLKKQIEFFAKSDSTILIYGESGTGKELVAQSIHQLSERRNGPFVAINCASLPESLLESELFGYEKGSFTGADKRGKMGLFELAHKGTIFLDEIGEIPLSLQAKLLRVLQEKEIRRLGSERVIPVDFRVLAATNKNLYEEVKKGNFREDLYYRLNVLSIYTPALRERKEDIEVLSAYFLKKFAAKCNKDVPFFSDVLLYKMRRYDWPGNVRELENFVERYVLLYGIDGHLEQIMDRFMEPFEFGTTSRSEQNSNTIEIEIGTLEEMESQILLKLMEKFHQKNKDQIAKLLGISRTTLWKKLKSANIM